MLFNSRRFKAKWMRRSRRLFEEMLGVFCLLRLLPLSRFGRVYGVALKTRNPEVILSLTTIPERIGLVHLCIESLLRQRVKADRIILWVSEECSGEGLSRMLRQQEKRGLTIRYCRDVGPQTKILHALKEFPEALVVSVDDDRQYHSRMLEVLLDAYEVEPDVVHCHVGINIAVDDEGRRTPLCAWFRPMPETDRGYLQLKPMGFAGVLYPPNVFHADVFDEALFRELCPYADDVWFKVMSLRQGTLCRYWSTLKRSSLGIVGTQGRSLSQINNKERFVEVQLDVLFERYDVLGLLRSKGCL